MYILPDLSYFSDSAVTTNRSIFMALLRFFKVPKHQRYEYKPRYWDQQKEELQERMDRVKRIQGDGADAMKARISSGLKRGYRGDQRLRKQRAMRSNMLLIGVIAVLVLLSYMALTIYLPGIVESIESSGVSTD